MNKCKNCSADFTVAEDEKNFIDKVSPTFDGKKFQIPEPKFCPRCREQRRLSHVNHVNLYKRKCDGTGKEIISNYAPDSPFKVYDIRYWLSDDFDPTQFGHDFDFNRSFFDQLDELNLAVPKQALFNDFVNDQNSDYTNYAGRNKNCYMLFDSDENEDCIYSFGINGSISTVDSYRVQKLELCYENVDCFNNYNCYFCTNSESCTDSAFSHNCASLTNCLFCVNLRHKEYHVFNEPVSKEEFEKIKEQLKSYQKVEEFKEKFKQLKLQFPHKYMQGVKNENVTGNNVVESKNALNCFDSMQMWDCKYVSQVFMSLKDSQHCTEVGESELMYDCCCSGYNGYGCLFNFQSLDNPTNLIYCNMCFRCQDCFGCVGLTNKKFCIFNKQYTQEEYDKKVAEILEYLTKTGEWGEFIPTKNSAFEYNLTAAQNFYPMTKEEVLTKGWKWRDPDQNEYQKQTYELADNIDDVNEDILDAILACDSCEKNYKIIPQEYKYYKISGIPVPRKCFNCRNKARIELRTPRNLWHRKCMCNHSKHDIHRGHDCPNEFETAYSPDRKEVVYCEECYLKEVI